MIRKIAAIQKPFLFDSIQELEPVLVNIVPKKVELVLYDNAIWFQKNDTNYAQKNGASYEC